MMPQKHENMNYDHSVANLSQPLPGEAKGGGHKVLTVFPSPLCSLRNLFLCQHDSKNIPTHGSLWRPSSSAQQVFWIRNSMNKMASILPSAYVRHGHSCTDVACWHLLSVFPVSYVGELPLRVVERAHHTLPENTHFTPTLLRLAVHTEIMSTFAFRETFCRLASPQTRSVWQGNKARWPSLSCSGHSPPTHLCLSFPISHHFLVFFFFSLSPVVKVTSPWSVWVCMWCHPHSLACHGRNSDTAAEWDCKWFPNLVSVELQPDESGPLLSGTQEKNRPGRKLCWKPWASSFCLSASSLYHQQLEGADNAVYW